MRQQPSRLDRWADLVLGPKQPPSPAGNGYEQLALDFTQADEADDRALHMDPMEWWAREMAARGNDVYLFAYQPTPSINPPRPRTLAAGYAKSISTLYIRFRNGSVYGYYNVTPNIWRNFRRAKSPGRYINRVLNFYPYAPEPDLDMPTGNR
ncbi:KTSC domain-containing protein [Nonomuraea sp. NPDC059023]|uniref:KTSC domain-containing protein n=1 Tax=unclassified Nonomuraea TaxID=2593643 RepID=UPI003687C93D